jgi:hypothetical protein
MLADDYQWVTIRTCDLRSRLARLTPVSLDTGTKEI